jgi:predicted MFS family arabinose efflux permease
LPTSSIDAHARSRLLLGGFLALAVGMGIGRFFYTPLLPLMQRSVGFGSDVAGLIASVNFVGYLVGALVAVLIPKGARLLVFRLALIASIATTIATGLTDWVPAWLVLRGIAGIASAFVFLFAAGIVAEALTAAGETARIGWLFGGVGVGIALSGLIVRIAGPFLDWFALWIAAGGICASLAPFIFATVKDGAVEPTMPQATVARRVPRPLPLLPLLVNYTCEGFGYSIMATFVVALVKARPGMEAVGDWVWVVVGLTGLPSTIFWSWVGERIGFSLALGLAYIAQLAGILLPIVTDSAAAALISAVFFGGTFMAITALVLALGRSAAKGHGFAILTAGFGVGQILGPLAAGYLAVGRANFDEALLISAGVIVVGLLFLALAVVQARAGEQRISAR